MKLSTDKMIAEKADGIGWMTFNQPERRNAISHEMRLAIIEILEDFETDDTVRVVIMKGAGDRAFVSGSDISRSEKGGATARDLEERGKVSARVQECYDALTKPLIAMIRGYCLGGGLGTALNADLRIAADDAQFGIPAARLGNAYNWRWTKRLVDVVGPASAKDILITARRFPASEALRMGLVHEVVPVAELERRVRERAAAIADNAPLSVRAAKAMIGEAMKDPADRDMDKVARLVKQCRDSDDFREGRRAFMEKRKPNWTGA